MGNKVIIYSCHVGNKDIPIQDGRLYVKGCDKFNTDRMNAKAPKILPHLYLPDHTHSIWLDANIELLVDKNYLIELLEDFDCMVFKHHHRNTIDEEAKECKTLDLKENIDCHINKPGILASCGFIVRANTSRCNDYNERWWAEICKGSFRDQLSFPYTLGKISKLLYPTENFPNTQFTKIHPHKK